MAERASHRVGKRISFISLSEVPDPEVLRTMSDAKFFPNSLAFFPMRLDSVPKRMAILSFGDIDNPFTLGVSTRYGYAWSCQRRLAGSALCPILSHISVRVWRIPLLCDIIDGDTLSCVFFCLFATYCYLEVNTKMFILRRV